MIWALTYPVSSSFSLAFLCILVLTSFRVCHAFRTKFSCFSPFYLSRPRVAIWPTPWAATQSVRSLPLFSALPYISLRQEKAHAYHPRHCPYHDSPTGSLSPNSSLIDLGDVRIVLGTGVGGDYPTSASVVSDRVNIRKRGTMLAYLVALCTFVRYISELLAPVWHIIAGLSLIPNVGMFYQRLTVPKFTSYST
jgi:hypothetical protein